MGARGRVRRRASGELATGKAWRSTQRDAPLLVDFEDEPTAMVSPAALSKAVTIRNRHVPIHLPTVQELEVSEGVDGISDRETLAEEEVKDKLGAEVGEAASWRAYLLSQLLTREDPLYHEVRDDGTVIVDEDLLMFAASTPLSAHPDERIDWPATSAGAEA